jgi:hypothetical protein
VETITDTGPKSYRHRKELNATNNRYLTNGSKAVNDFLKNIFLTDFSATSGEHGGYKDIRRMKLHPNSEVVEDCWPKFNKRQCP